MSSCGTSLVQNSVVPFQRLRISPVCGQVSSIVISLCCPKNLTVVLLRSVRSWQNGCSSCIGSNSVRMAPFCFPSSLAFHHKGFSLVHPFHAEIQCRCYQFLVFCCQMLKRSTDVFCSVSNCRRWHGRLHFRQNRCVAGCQLGSCVPVAQNSSRVEANAATVRLSSQLALQFPKEQMCTAQVNVAAELFLNSFDNKSGAPPGTTCTRNTPLTPANSNK